MRKKLLFLILFISIGTTCIQAAITNTGAQFLNIGPGTRSIAMGRSFAGLAEGIESIYWNPAGLSSITTYELSMTHAEYLAGMDYENFAFAYKSPFGTVGISAIGLLSGDILKTTLDDPDGDINNEHYSANDMSLGFSYARIFTNKFTGGITFKVINQNIDLVSATGWAIDLGAHYKTMVFKNLRIGFALRNFGPDMQYHGQGLQFEAKKSDNPDEETDIKSFYSSGPYALPMSFELGFAMDVINNDNQKLLVTLSGVNSIDQQEALIIGAEYQLANKISLRFGIPGLTMSGDVNDKDITLPKFSTVNNRWISFGGAIKLLSMQIDYSYESHQFLSPIHRFTIGLAR